MPAGGSAGPNLHATPIGDAGAGSNDGPSRHATPIADVGAGSSEGPRVSIPTPSPGSSLHVSAHGLGSTGIAGQQHPEQAVVAMIPDSLPSSAASDIEVKIEAINEVSERSVPMGPQQALELQEALRPGDGSTVEPPKSFASLCIGGSAEAAANRFMDLLNKHMDGTYSLSQAQPWGDIMIGRGPNWI